MKWIKFEPNVENIAKKMVAKLNELEGFDTKTTQPKGKYKFKLKKRRIDGHVVKKIYIFRDVPLLKQFWRRKRWQPICDISDYLPRYIHKEATSAERIILGRNDWNCLRE